MAFGVPVVFVMVLPVGMLFMFGAESPYYAAVAQTILSVPPATCWIVAVICGLSCLSLSKDRDAAGQRTIAWMFGVVSLVIAGIELLGVALIHLFSP
ncbi:hypothetical protein [Paenarthrobacter nitroguajacolicus]|uniref:hypothetical protein n=1 Tax=Paenarthrobacter nitroguajacolicus TaxID=211146 RepID=UPI0040539164